MLIGHSYSSDLLLIPNVVDAFKCYFDLTNDNSKQPDWISAEFVPFLVLMLKDNSQHFESLTNCCISFGNSIEITSEVWHSFHDSLIATATGSLMPLSQTAINLIFVFCLATFSTVGKRIIYSFYRLFCLFLLVYWKIPTSK